MSHSFLDEGWEMFYSWQAEELEKQLKTCSEEEKPALEKELKEAKHMKHVYFDINNAGYWLPD